MFDPFLEFLFINFTRKIRITWDAQCMNEVSGRFPVKTCTANSSLVLSRPYNLALILISDLTVIIS